MLHPVCVARTPCFSSLVPRLSHVQTKQSDKKLDEASILYSYFDEMFANLILVQKGTLVCVFEQLHLWENDASCSWYCSTEFRHVILG